MGGRGGGGRECVAADLIGHRPRPISALKMSRHIPPPRTKRGFTAPPTADRCTANITLRDGSGAACMHRRVAGTDRCWQHPRRTPEKLPEKP